MLEKMSKNSSKSGSHSDKSDKSRSSSLCRKRRSRSPSDQNRYANSNNHRHHRRSRSNGRSYSRSRSRSRTSPPPPLPSSPKYRRKNNRYSYGSRSPRSRSRSHSSSRRRRNSYDRRGRTHSRSPLSQRRRHDHPQECRCLGIFGLSAHTTEQKIEEIFSKFGPIERVQIVIDAKTGKSRGFCFVYYEHLEDAKAAKEQLSGIEVDGRRIRVDYSITQRAHTPTPGVYMGKATRLYREREYHDRYRDEAYNREK